MHDIAAEFTNKISGFRIILVGVELAQITRGKDPGVAHGGPV
jgi:hypothetical protein